MSHRHVSRRVYCLARTTDDRRYIKPIEYSDNDAPGIKARPLYMRVFILQYNNCMPTYTHTSRFCIPLIILLVCVCVCVYVPSELTDNKSYCLSSLYIFLYTIMLFGVLYLPMNFVLTLQPYRFRSQRDNIFFDFGQFLYSLFMYIMGVHILYIFMSLYNMEYYYC